MLPTLNTRLTLPIARSPLRLSSTLSNRRLSTVPLKASSSLAARPLARVTSPTASLYPHSLRASCPPHRQLAFPAARSLLSRRNLASLSSLPSSIPNMTIPILPPCPPIPQADGPVDLKLPPTEDRQHRYFTLPNGLEVIVISDPKADKAAASMDVGVGHLSDPANLPGCAHFCEHLMFMGTKTYPSENDYSSYLKSHNGHSNAYTAMTSTNYFFDVSPDALEGALDRFAGFFYEPLFAEDCTEREINAVNSEHKKNLQNDMWRFFQLEKSLSKPGHPYGKFGTGNLETLWTTPQKEGRDPRQQLIQWWKDEYCARRMKLAVAGRHDLDTLERWVRDRFGAVPVRTEGRAPTGPDGVRVTFEDPPYGPDQHAVVTCVKPVRDVYALEISCPVPDLNHLYTVKPLTFLSHFLGHEGKGSLLSYLKKQGWANSLSAGDSHGANGFSFFKVAVELTPEGLQHWKDVSLAVFKYMTLLHTNPPTEEMFIEQRKLADIGFKFAERGKTANYVTRLSTWLQDPVPRDEVISSNYLLGDYQPEVVSAAIQLLDPRQASIGITSRELPKNIPDAFNKKEPIYGTEYLQFKLDDAFLREAISGAPIPDLHLPGPNLFIPEKLDVAKAEVPNPATRPELLVDTELSRLWHKQDDRFWLPKTNVYVELKSPLLHVTPRNSVLGRLLADLFVDSITEDIYDASLAGLEYHCAYGGESLIMYASGYTDKLALLTETMLQKLVNFKVDPARFGKVVDQVKLHWKNFALGEPYQVASYYAAYATTPLIWTQQEKLKEIDFVTPADVERFSKELFQRLYIETLVHGNTTTEEAKGVQDMLERTLHSRALTPAEKAGLRTLLLPEGSQYVWEIPVVNPAEPNSCVIHTSSVCDTTDPISRTRLALLAQIASEPAFNVLRTKEQLGYVCQASMSSTISTVDFRVLVQSERDPVYVETRIEAFLEGLQETLESLTDEEFERHRKSLIDKKEEVPKNLGEETGRFWKPISDKHYEFGKRDADIAALRSATKEEVLELYKKHIHPAAKERRKLSIHLKSQYRGVKFDPASTQPLIGAFVQAGVAVDQAALTTLLQGNPDLDTVKEFAIRTVDSAAAAGNVSAEAAASLKAQVGELKGNAAKTAEADAAAKLHEGNVYVKDIHEFKSSLEPSKAAIPVEPLVVSKL